MAGVSFLGLGEVEADKKQGGSFTEGARSSFLRTYIFFLPFLDGGTGHHFPF